MRAGSAGGGRGDERSGGGSRQSGPGATSGFQTAEIAAFLRRNAEQLDAAKFPEAKGIAATPLARETASTLRDIAADLEAAKTLPRLEDLERRLTVAEEKLFAVLLAATPDEQIVAVRAEADRELAPYRRKMPAAQIEQLLKQYVHKRLLEKYRVAEAEFVLHVKCCAILLPVRSSFR